MICFDPSALATMGEKEAETAFRFGCAGQLKVLLTNHRIIERREGFICQIEFP
jgi:hypothetical protein